MAWVLTVCHTMRLRVLRNRWRSKKTDLASLEFYEWRLADEWDYPLDLSSGIWGVLAAPHKTKTISVTLISTVKIRFSSPTYNFFWQSSQRRVVLLQFSELLRIFVVCLLLDNSVLKVRATNFGAKLKNKIRGIFFEAEVFLRNASTLKLSTMTSMTLRLLVIVPSFRDKPDKQSHSF